MCDFCKETHDESIMIKQRCQHYRLKSNSQLATIAKLRRRRDEDATYVNKLKALNTHLTTTCAVKQREVEKLHEAFEHTKHLCIALQGQCEIFAEIFRRASSKEDGTRETLLQIMTELNVKPANLLL